MRELKSILVALSFGLALLAVPLAGAGCNDPTAAIDAGCAGSCCLPKECCVISAGQTLPSTTPFVLSSVGPLFLSAPSSVRLVLVESQPDAHSGGRLTEAASPPRVTRALLCTFLI
ncbi:MAG TPA: hypothetical protein VGK72_07560 [Chthoniobacterales bacterium]